MIRTQEVCVDAGLATKQVVTEPDSALAERLFTLWADSHVQLIAPLFFQVEVDSILRQKLILRHELSSDEADDAFAGLQLLGIRLIEEPGQRERAWQIAKRFSLPVVYDATYLALAELRGCEYWTADQRLVKRVGSELKFVRWLGDFVPTC